MSQRRRGGGEEGITANKTRCVVCLNNLGNNFVCAEKCCRAPIVTRVAGEGGREMERREGAGGRWEKFATSVCDVVLVVIPTACDIRPDRSCSRRACLKTLFP